MAPFIRNIPYTGPVQAIILDWAGTAVDYGCLGPAAVFVAVFEAFGIQVGTHEARQFMGLEKKAHIQAMCELPTVVDQWRKQYDRTPDAKDVDALYAQTEPMMVNVIDRHAEPIPGLLDFVAAMRDRQIRIGACTGYTAPMMDVLVPAARERGYHPDATVCSSDVPAGRPFPWMCYLNALKLEIYPFEAMIKIGDTISDIQEGLNAGMWTIGLTQSGNELGLSEEDVQVLPADELARRLTAIEDRYQDAGAHYVARGIWEVLPILEAIEARLACGERP